MKTILTNAFAKILEIITSRKASVLALSTWLLSEKHISQEIWAAIAMVFMGVISALDYKKMQAIFLVKNKENQKEE